jgi:hypothetical protein
MTERWSSIPGISFEVSSFGRIRNTVTGRVRKPQFWKGYYRIRIGGKTFKIHRLVASAFVPNPNNLPEVNHKDGVGISNFDTNLEWSTHADNMRHAIKKGLWKPAKFGEENGASKLTKNQIRKIRKKYIRGKIRQIDLAAEFGVSQRMISLIVRNEKWQHV